VSDRCIKHGGGEDERGEGEGGEGVQGALCRRLKRNLRNT
jgi:hypothetical protein